MVRQRYEFVEALAKLLQSLIMPKTMATTPSQNIMMMGWFGTGDYKWERGA